MEQHIAEGEAFVSFLYTYRSLMHALGNAKPKREDVKPQFYHAICQVMRPHILKLYNLTEYVARAIDLFTTHAKSLVMPPGGDVAPRELLIDKLIALLDTLVVIDTVKGTKACLTNDFSFYRRQAQAMQQREVAESLKAAGKDPVEFAVDPEMQFKLSEFLHSSFLPPGPKGKLLPTVVGSIQQEPRFESMIAQCLHHAQAQYESHKYVLPKEKWRLVRVMTVCACIIGWHNEVYTEKAARQMMSKEVKLDRLLAHIREYPAIPLFGDMQLAPASLLVLSPYFERMRQEKPHESLFIMPANAQGRQLAEHQKAYQLSEQIGSIQATFDKYGASVSRLLRPVESFVSLGRPVPVEMASQIKTVIMQGIILLADWSEMVLKLAAYKYSRPCQVEEGDQAIPYEMAVLLNYSDQEKNVLVDMIGYIKGLSSILKRAEKVVAGVLRMAIHREVQKIVQHVCSDTIMKEDKKGRLTAKIKALQDIVGDWHGGIPPIDEPFHSGKLLFHNGKTAPRAIPRRVAAPTRTQLVLMRALIQSICAETKTSEEKQQLEGFLQSSFFYGHLLGLSSLADTCADMGDLWYRERYLEFSKQSSEGKDMVQFPIRMSLPWILIEHVVKSPNAAHMENVLYTLDMYNDAAERALDVLGKQHIFDEVQAELNLCFDQVVYLLSERAYVYFKQQACGLQMDKKQRVNQLRRNVEHAAANPGARPRGAHHIPTCASSIEKLMAVRNLSLLGRVINLNKLITLRINKHLVENIESVIKRFESGGIQAVKELELNLNNISLTHSLLSEHLELDSFENMLKEANDDMSAVSFHGRIVIHALAELIGDLFPNFVYNTASRRFTRGSTSEAHAVPPAKRALKLDPIDQIGGSTRSGTEPSAMSRYMAQAAKLYQTFVGVEHLEALIRVLGRNNMPLIVYQLMKNLDMKVTNVLAPYFKALAQGFPDRSFPIKDILALVNKMTATAGMESMVIPGVFQVFQIALKDILKYPDMKPEVFQTLRDVGNCMVFMQLLDTASRMSESTGYMQYAPFIGTPSVSAAEVQSGRTPLYRTVCAMVDKLNAVWPRQDKPPWSSRVSFDDVRRCAQCAEGLANEAVRQLSTSYFKAAVMLIDKFVDPIRKEILGGAALATDAAYPLAAQGFVDAEGTLEFHRLYSAIQFLMNEIEEDGEPPDSEIFGDGLAWGGCVIIHVLGQRQRFNLLDYSYQLVKMADQFAPEGSLSAAPHIEQFLSRARQGRRLNDAIFDQLSSAVPVSSVHAAVLPLPELPMPE